MADGESAVPGERRDRGELGHTDLTPVKAKRPVRGDGEADETGVADDDELLTDDAHQSDAPNAEEREAARGAEPRGDGGAPAAARAPPNPSAQKTDQSGPAVSMRDEIPVLRGYQVVGSAIPRTEPLCCVLQ